MSKPKQAIGSVKHRGLAIVTAVAVTGSGIATTNYVSALEEDRDPTQEELQRDFAGTEADAIAKEAAQRAHDALVAGDHDQVDQAFLEALNKAAGTGGSGFTKEDLDAIGEEELKYQIGNLVADEKESPRLDRRIAAVKNKNNTGEAATAGEETQSAPTVDEAFESEKATIQALLKETKNAEKTAQQVAGKFKNRFDTDESAFGKFEYDLEREVKKYFQSLVDSGEIKFAPGYSPQQPENSGNELEEAQQTAAAQIDAIRALTENEKTAFKEKIKAADSSSAISEILTAAKQMADEHVAEEAGKGTLEAEKDHAQKTIEGFTNLTAEQKSELKSQIAAAKTGAIVQNLIERAEQLNSKLSGRPGSPEQKPSGEGATDDSQVLEKPSSKFGFSNIAKGLFGVTAILGVIGIVFGGVAHAIKHFPGFEHVHNQVRETLTKFGIRF